MVLVNVIKRFINTIPMQQNISQNDENVITYRFQIERNYEGLDLGANDWEWSIAWRNSLDEPNALLINDVETTDEYVYVDWTPRWVETASSGLFEFQIRAKRDSSSGELEKWNSQIARLDFNSSIGLGKVDRGILEDYLDKFMQLCSTATIDAEQRRAIAAELALAERITNHEERVEAQFEIISNALTQISQNLQDFDTQAISHYTYIDSDEGEIAETDTLDQALSKLQYQIKNIQIDGTLPISKGGTGVSSFNKGIVYSDGATIPLKSVDGTNGQFLGISGNKPVFKNLNISDLSDGDTILKFHKLSDSEITLPDME